MNSIAGQGYRKVWRPQQVGGFELSYSVTQSYDSPLHFHSELEIACCQGQAWQLHYRGTNYTVPPGAIALSAPGEVHRAQFSGETSATFRGWRVEQWLVESIATERAGKPQSLPIFSVPVVIDRPLSQQILRFHRLMEAPTSLLERQTLVFDVLTQLIERSDWPAVLRSIGQEGRSLQPVRDYLEDYYAENLSLPQLAALVNLSPFYLNRAFRQTFGLPPHAYQTQVRLARAKPLLAKGQSIAQVALEVGFSNQSHFGQHFKRLVGVTPGQYAQESKNSIDSASSTP